MSLEDYDELTNLWAVGGRQIGLFYDEITPFYYKFCPGCGWKLTGKFSTCPRCGEDLRTAICTYCRGEIPAGVENCPRCTADFLSYS